MKTLPIILSLLLIASGEIAKPSFSSYEQYSSWVAKTYNAETVKPSSTNIYKMKYYKEGEYMQIFFLSNKSKGYLYQNVSQALWNEFKNAPSQGKFYHRHIKPNQELKIRL